VDAMNSACAQKRWLDVLSLASGHKVVELPNDNELDTLYFQFVTKKLTALVKTKADLSASHPVSLAETVRLAMPSPSPGSVQRCYIDGKPCLGNERGYAGSLTSKWTRHPDGIGWYIEWAYLNGEIFIVPGADVGDMQGFLASNGQIAMAGPVLEPNRREKQGLLGILTQKMQLGEISKEQALKALDDACLKRYEMKRRAAIGL
jgi:hypothetical protein